MTTMSFVIPRSAAFFCHPKERSLFLSSQGAQPFLSSREAKRRGISPLLPQPTALIPQCRSLTAFGMTTGRVRDDSGSVAFGDAIGINFSITVDMPHNLVQYVTMIRLNIHEAKTHLSRYLDRVARGETVLLCKRNVPVAEIRPLPVERTGPRPIGLAKGELVVPADFFLPLPDDLQSAFEGRKP